METTTIGQMTTSAEANKELVRQYFDGFWVRRDYGVADRFLAKDVLFHDLVGSPLGLPAGSEGVKKIAGIFWKAAPDLKMTLDDLVAEGDKVTMRFTNFLTHTGDLAGLPPTHRSTEFVGIAIVRIAEGKIVEGWQVMDFVTAYQDLGVMPKGPPPAPLKMFILLRGKMRARQLRKEAAARDRNS
jgi:predicted ester cyclase